MSKQGYYDKVKTTFTIGKFKYDVYCSCINCKSQWKYEAESYGVVTGPMTSKKFDYCDDCKEEYERNKG